MRNVIVCILFIFNHSLAYCQQIDYKKGMIRVDGKDYAKIEVKKQNFGLSKSFEVYTLSGEKIIIASVAADFESDRRDNSYMFYRLSFLSGGQIGIFKVPSLGLEKSFARLIGLSGILINDKADDAKVKEFITRDGAGPAVAIDYTTVQRDRVWPVRLMKNKNIEQNSRIIGNFKPTGSESGTDHYEFMLPTGVIIALLSFTGENNAQNFELFTPKDNLKRIVLIPKKDKTLAADTSIDKNQFTIERIAKWLVENGYL